MYYRLKVYYAVAVQGFNQGAIKVGVGPTDHLPHIHFQKTILCIYYAHLPKCIHFCKAGRKERELKKEGWN